MQLLHRSFLLLALLPLSLSAAPASAERGPNLYWPGDFEARFEGGIFGSQTNLALSTEANHTPGGRQSWKLNRGYQHLELLVPFHRKGTVSFWVLAAQPQTFVLKVVDPTPGVPVTPENPVSTRDQTLAIPASSEWQHHTLEIETVNAWPKPPVSEILLSFYHPEGGPVFIDDLEVRMAPDPAPAALLGRSVVALTDAAFFEGLTLGSTAPNTSFVQRPLKAEALSSRRVRVSADVTYLSMNGEIKNWASILFVMVKGHASDSPAIAPIGDWPFWAPIGHAAPVGKPRRITAEYQVPADADTLSLQVLAQPGLGSNLARISGLTFEVID